MLKMPSRGDVCYLKHYKPFRECTYTKLEVVKVTPTGQISCRDSSGKVYRFTPSGGLIGSNGDGTMLPVTKESVEIYEYQNRINALRQKLHQLARDCDKVVNSLRYDVLESNRFSEEFLNESMKKVEDLDSLCNKLYEEGKEQ